MLGMTFSCEELVVVGAQLATHIPRLGLLNSELFQIEKKNTRI